MRYIRIWITSIVLALPAAAAAQTGPPPQAAPAPAKPETLERPSKPDAPAPPAPESGNRYVNGELATTATDRGFGQHRAQRDERFANIDDTPPLVDRRQSISPMPDRNILTPMAQTIAAGNVSMTNFNFTGTMVTAGVTDDFAMTGSFFIPINDGDLVATLSGKYKLYDSRNIIVSVLPFGAYSNGTARLDSYQLGVGSGLLADFHLTDWLVVGAGASGFATLAAGYDRNRTDCTRSEYRSESCGVETVNLGLPAGGHWLSATLGAKILIPAGFALSVEGTAGASWGTFLGLDNDGGGTLEQRRDRFEDPDVATGFPHGQRPTVAFGASWSSHYFGIQLAMVGIPGQDNPNTLVIDEGSDYNFRPLLTGAFQF